jgi:hypothetical protein
MKLIVKINHSVLLLVTTCLVACIEEPVAPSPLLETELSIEDQIDLFIEENMRESTGVDAFFSSRDSEFLPNDFNMINDLSYDLDDFNMSDLSDSYISPLPDATLSDAFIVADALVLPPLEASPEICDGIDNDLDYWIDEEVSNPCGGCTPMEEQGCMSWQWQMIQGESTTLNTNRILSAAAYVSEYQDFNLDNAECILYVSPTQSVGSLGLARLESPLASLQLQVDPMQRGRYQVVPSLEEDIILHRPTDQVTLYWNGWQSTQNQWSDVTAGELTLTSPPFMEESVRSSLQDLIQTLGDQTDHGNDLSLPIYWQPAETGQVHLYIGASRLRVRQGDYQVIDHYQVQGHLADDGIFNFPLIPEMIHPQYSIWVYLERREHAFVDLGQHHLVGRIGHRVEVRQSAIAGDSSALAMRLISPDPQMVEIDPTQGIRVAWESTAVLDHPATVSLVRYDLTRVEQLICRMQDTQSRSVVIPSEWLTFWPQGPGSFKQITVRIDDKIQNFTLPDRGYIRSSTSLILPLNTQ